MVIHTDFNQGIQIGCGGNTLIVQATLEKGRMRYWVGKPDEVTVTMIQCRANTKLALRPSAASMSRPPSST